MNLDEIKKIIEEDGGKFIIVEQGKPIMVITSFEDYAKKKLKSPARHSPEAKPMAGGEKKTAEPVLRELTEDELKIEDLPF